tara:strand:- start:153 stop:473 length:321 start_codon:yes stop_codon:yes gene_type:complete
MIVVHNVKSGVTLIARHSDDTLELALSMCKRTSDTFSKKRGYRTALKRLNRSPLYANVKAYDQEYIGELFDDLIRVVKSFPRRRSVRDVCYALDDMIKRYSEKEES